MHFRLLTWHTRGVGPSPSPRQSDAKDHQRSGSPPAAQPHASSAGRARFQSAPGVVHQRTGDVTALVDLRRNLYFTLNEVGGLVWELLTSDSAGSDEAGSALSAGQAPSHGSRADAPPSSPVTSGQATNLPARVVESIAAQIAAEYDVPVSRVRSDVAALLRELASAGLVIWVSEQ